MRLDDELFVNRCLEGDQAAFTCLVSKYKEMVHAYAYYRVGNYQEAQDIAQEVFIKAYSKLGQLKWPHRFQSWLYSIVANECKMWLRKRSKEREQEVPLENVPADELNGIAMRPHDDEDMEETVIVAMESLPADNQLALSLYYMSNLSIKEIAYFLGTSPGNVKVKLHRARKQLGERMEKMIGKQLNKEKLRSGFVFKLVDSIRDMPIPSLPKPRPTKWIPVPISIGMALLIGIIGYGVSSGKDVSPDMLILKPTEAIFEVSLLPDLDRQTILDVEPENINDLASADAGATTQTQPATGTTSSGIVIRRLSDNTQYYSGRISPDGRYLSYVNWKTGGNLAIQDLETGERRDVTDEGNSGLDWHFADISTWSPDSKQIAYVWWRGSGDKSGYRDLRIVGINGAKPRVLYSSPAESGALGPRAWSWDGKHILAGHWKEGDETCIVLVAVADGSMRVLKSLHGHSFGRFGHWMILSPDGRYVAYDYPQSEDSLKHDISLLETDRGSETTLVEHPANDFAPFWMPDGNRIVFASDRSGSMGIWVLEVVDGKPEGSPRLISDNLNGMFPLGLTQDGSYYYGLPGRTNDIYFADLDPETGKVVKPPYKAVQAFEGLNGKPDFSPDGKRLVYARGGLPFRSLVLRSLETGEERVLQPDIPLSHLAYFAPRWFPDGRSILVVAKYTDSAKETRWGLHQINVETGAVTHVIWNDEKGRIYRSTSPVWFPDGSKIFFMREGDGNSIRIYDLEAKREWSPDFRSKPGNNYKKHNLAISPDGQQLAFIGCLEDGHSLQIVPAAGGETREVIMLPKTSFLEKAGLVWTPDGHYLLFGKWNEKDKKVELWRISVEGGEPENLGLATERIEHLSIHPDGRRIAFTGLGPKPEPEVWVMENIPPTSTTSR